jgi:predicted phosphate transport protein (TIGR00153 family)
MEPMSIGRSFRALLKSNDRRFIDLLCEQADLALQALHLLEQVGKDVNLGQSLLEDVKKIERAGDNTRRILIEELLHTYATPFDREDIFALSRAIDDILDAANETAIELGMYRITTMENLAEMASVLADGARHILAAVRELADHPGVAAEHAVRAKRMENRMDELYHQAVSHLLDSETKIRQVLKLREIYRHLKNSADRIDEAADQISIIVIKHR